MKPAKSLNDFPEYIAVREAVQKAQLDLQRISERRGEITEILMAKAHPREDNAGSAWARYSEGGGSDIDYSYSENRELQEEILHLDQREKFLTQALEQGRLELDAIHGKTSLEICATHRPEFVAEIRKLLSAVKTICDINMKLSAMRVELESQNIQTGSLANALFDLGGTWSDPYGGRVVDYQRHISEFYPELTDAAGWSVKAKLTELGARQRAFEEVSDAS